MQTCYNCGFIFKKNKRWENSVRFCKDCKGTYTCAYFSRLRSKRVTEIGASLSLEDFISLKEGVCYYCGEIGVKSIDRKDSYSGYHKENCVSSCMDCNRIKNTLTVKQFFNQIEKVYFNLKNKIL